METPELLQLHTGEVFAVNRHDTKIEVNDFIMGDKTISDTDHINVMIDGELVALMNRWQMIDNSLVLYRCVKERCFCRAIGSMYAQALFSETDVTPSANVRHELETEFLELIV